MRLWKFLRRRVQGLRLPKAPEDCRWVLSEQGRGALLAPASYSMHSEAEDTVAVYPPGPQSGVTLRFSFHTSMLHRGMPSDVAM